ncbi:hypothetical protein M4D55_20925 [Metabacillus idriensis]|uniref:Uncharacterized protein n=1 Tax=Metabacillus idriensis TaxID=324768 RepID=A0A6I2MBL8_9BACI|nr:hypothetical protein [Metabacillus idriensis]MCM3598227.1 hypothetical protein [Metabacillus idriensis]MRX55149.1 hypothetical protein [Metabacillus idriensis]OHR71783.1 hypothetical protein HMPREF3291_23415 [Bacillus sp. HMSC76G11]
MKMKKSAGKEKSLFYQRTKECRFERDRKQNYFANEQKKGKPQKDNWLDLSEDHPYKQFLIKPCCIAVLKLALTAFYLGLFLMF